MWKVREQKHSTGMAVKDEHFDKVTEFESEDSEDEAHYYYTHVFNDNYFTDLQEFVNGKWENRASSCVSALAK